MKSSEIVKILKDLRCPVSISIATFANMMVSALDPLNAATSLFTSPPNFHNLWIFFLLSSTKLAFTPSQRIVLPLSQQQSYCNSLKCISSGTEKASITAITVTASKYKREHFPVDLVRSHCCKPVTYAFQIRANSLKQA